MLTRRTMVGSGMAALATTLIAKEKASAAAPRRKPNLLYILADDHAGYMLGADGNLRAKTPNLDRLASQGVRFAQHYCNSPVCTPSRQSFFTSLLPHASGVTVLETPLRDDSPTLARQLEASGYAPAVLGKMHFNTPGRTGLHGFAECRTEDVVRRQWMAEPARLPVSPGIPTKPAWRPFKTPVQTWMNVDKLPYPRHEPEMEGTWVARQAVRHMEQHRGQPFALWVSFAQPHSPFDFPVESRAEFDAASFAVPALGPADFEQCPLIFQGLTNGQKQGIIAAYYTSVSFLDRNVGIVLDALHDLKLEDDTLVIYMSDHGYSLGQHGRFEKHVCYDPALRVPLIIRYPGRVQTGKTVHQFTESIDVPPTILDLLGAAPFAVNHGASLRPYLEGRTPEKPRTSIFSEYLENEEACLRTERWKFIYCTGKRVRRDGYITANPLPGRRMYLYDLQADPEEFIDVSAAHAVICGQFVAEMLALFRATHPESGAEPAAVAEPDALDWYLRPRDTAPVPACRV